MYLAQQSLPTALRFLDAAEDAFAQLAAMPEIGGRYESANPALADLRQWPISGFRSHWVFYRYREGRVEVARVLHASRDLDRLLNAAQPT
jgi:toxin ParE1/3/4